MLQDEPYDMMKRIITGYDKEYEDTYLDEKSEEHENSVENILERNIHGIHKEY